MHLDNAQLYRGRAETEGHVWRAMNSEHFNPFCQHLLETLEAHGVADADIREVVHRVAMLKNDITGESY